MNKGRDLLKAEVINMKKMFEEDVKELESMVINFDKNSFLFKRSLCSQFLASF